MAGLADLDADARGERGGQAKLRAEHAENQRIAAPDQFDAATAQTPSILRRCISSSSVSMLRTTAQTRGGSLSRQVSSFAAWSVIVTICAK